MSRSESSPSETSPNEISHSADIGPADISVPLSAVVDDPGLALAVVHDTLRPGALERPVRWAHVSELLDPKPYLSGQELLLTAGVNLPLDANAMDGYVLRLRASGITALGFGITPPQHEVLPDSLRAACIRHGLTLLVVPAGTPFLAISRAVSLAISRAAQRDQLRVSEAREALTRLAPDGTGEVTRELARRIAGWAALVGTEDQVVAEYRSPWPLPVEVAPLLTQLRARSGIRNATTETSDGTFVVAQPVYPQATASHLLVVGRSSRFDRAERSIIAVGAAMLGLAGRAGSDTARVGGAATSLLLGAAPNQVMSELLGAPDFRVAAGIAKGAGPREAEAGYEWLRSKLETPLVHLGDGPRFTAIVPRPPGAAILAELPAKGWLIAVGSPASADRLPAALAEMDALLDRARALDKPVVAEAAGLSTVIAPEAAARFADNTLGSLRRQDAERGEDLLVPTLRSWLAHHGNWERTASALGIHRNSVRHRIGQIERVLGVDLADPDTRAELWLALRWGSGIRGVSSGGRSGLSQENVTR